MLGSESQLNRLFERTLFAMRWLLAPFFLAMTLAIVALLVVFLRVLFEGLAHVRTLDAEGAILLSLSLIDLTLTGNLLLVVMLAGYENFISRLHFEQREDRPDWMATVDFADLKIKVISSIVAISAVSLLRVFLLLGDPAQRVDSPRIEWMIAIMVTFVLSVLLLSVADRMRPRPRRVPRPRLPRVRE